MNPGWDDAGFSVRPIVNIANRTMEQLCGGEGLFPWKWNQFNLPLFYWNSWQQDYALIGEPGAEAEDGGPSVTNLAWLQEGMAVDINNPSMPKPWSPVSVGRNQSRMTGSYISNSIYIKPVCYAIFLPNNLLYFGTWGAAQDNNATWGNNPQAGQLITNPRGPAGQAMPNNPILQIEDENGNLLVLTTFGTTGNSAPSAAANSNPGTTVDDGTCVWTVVDPYGYGIRITPVPSQTGTVWQMNLVGQMKPTKFSGATSTSLKSQTLFPLTDDFYQRFLDGCAAECMLYSSNPKIRAGYEQANAKWIASLLAMRKGVDREPELNNIQPKRTVIGAGGSGMSSNLGPFWPFGYPVS